MAVIFMHPVDSNLKFNLQSSVINLGFSNRSLLGTHTSWEALDSSSSRYCFFPGYVEE